MKIFQIIKSVLSAFCGIQSNNNFYKDDEFIKNNGVKINKALVSDELKILSANDFDNNSEILVSVGKKKHFIIKNS